MTEPTGISLKAAYLLLRELKRYPQLPSMEELALILDNTLRYEWAVRLIHVSAGYPCDDDNMNEFSTWAWNTLIGPETREADEPEQSAPDSFVGLLGPRKPSLYPAPPPLEAKGDAE